MKRQIILTTLAAALLSSCGVYKNYKRPDNITANGIIRDTASSGAMSLTDTTNFGNTPWREVFTDKQLQALITTALERNADLKTAELKLQEAKASYLPAKLAFLPSLSLSPNGTISSYDGGKATQTYSIPVQASWMLDVSGGLLNAKKLAGSNVLMAKASIQATQTQIIANVASMYFSLLMLDEQLDITRRTAEIWKKNVEAMRLMQTTTTTTVAAVKQSEANYYQVLSTIPTLKQSIRETENSLSVLLHQAPGAISRSKLSEQNVPTGMSAGVPMQLLSNRPDVCAAELSLRTAFYATNYARSQFYPQITLTGSAGWTNNSGVGIINPAKFLASAVGSLVQPLFRNGQLKGNLMAAKAQQEEAQLAFEKKLLTAGQEVSNALFSYQSTSERMVQRKLQLAAQEKADEATQELFQRSSSTTYLETLTSQQSLLSARLSYVSDEFDRLQAVVSLYQALGGGRN